VIVSHNYPYLDITCWVGAQKLQGSAYVDTGFDGCLIVPEAEAKKLMVPFSGQRVFAGTRSRGPDTDLLSLGRKAGSRVPETVRRAFGSPKTQLRIGGDYHFASKNF
jgi:hypothetical protein